MKQIDSAFDSWYNGMVGFHINSERIHEDLFCFDSSPEEKAEMLRKWMAVCWNSALDAAKSQLVHDDYYYDNGNKWNDDCYSSTDPKTDIEDLKEKV